MNTKADTIRTTVAQYLSDRKITVEWTFVPFSQSRNKGEKDPSLNYRAAILRDGRPVKGLDAVDYMMGCAHCPSYQSPHKARSALQQKAIAWECENGRPARIHPSGEILPASKTPILPNVADLFYSLTLDADVLDHPTFDDWAAEFGYDTDSRKGEAIYQQCLQLALALRALLGETGIADLREMMQDY